MRGKRNLTLLHLVCAAAFFSFLVFTIQSSFFAGSGKQNVDLREQIEILSDFQSNVQQCVANRGLGITAHITNHCNLTLKFPPGTNSTWFNTQFKIFSGFVVSFWIIGFSNWGMYNEEDDMR